MECQCVVSQYSVTVSRHCVASLCLCVTMSLRHYVVPPCRITVLMCRVTLSICHYITAVNRGAHHEDREQQDDDDEKEFNLPPLVAIIVLLLYIFLGSFLYIQWERWGLLDAFYFIFITFSYVCLRPVYSLCKCQQSQHRSQNLRLTRKTDYLKCYCLAGVGDLPRCSLHFEQGICITRFGQRLSNGLRLTDRRQYKTRTRSDFRE